MKKKLLMLMYMAMLGLSCSGIRCSQEPIDGVQSFVDHAKQDSTQKDVQILEVQPAAIPVAASSPSTWSKVKGTFFNSLSVIKNFCKVSWQKVVGCLSAR